MKHHRPNQFQEETPLPNPFAAPVAETLSKNASVFGRSFATMQKESMRFFNQRLEENMKSAKEFGACKSLPDLFAAQQKWFAGMTRAYTEEWQRYSEIMTDIMHENDETSEKRPRPDETH